MSLIQPSPSCRVDLKLGRFSILTEEGIEFLVGKRSQIEGPRIPKFGKISMLHQVGVSPKLPLISILWRSVFRPANYWNFGQRPWLSGGADAGHAEGSKFNPWYFQLKDLSEGDIKTSA